LAGNNDSRPELSDPNEPCRYCKKVGHTDKDCFKLANKKQAEEAEKLRLDYLQPNVSSAKLISTDHNDKINEPNKSNDVVRPSKEEDGNTVRNVVAGDTDDDLIYLEVLLNGTSRACLCDTGSQLSLIPQRFVDPENIVPKISRIRAANGVIIDTLGSCKVNIQIGENFHVDSEFIVSTHTNIPVLGMDWMTTNATG